ncbi:hypothetical protein Tco_0671381, partial [Tanacetum coccineum]
MMMTVGGQRCEKSGDDGDAGGGCGEEV